MNKNAHVVFRYGASERMPISYIKNYGNSMLSELRLVLQRRARDNFAARNDIFGQLKNLGLVVAEGESFRIDYDEFSKLDVYVKYEALITILGDADEVKLKLGCKSNKAPEFIMNVADRINNFSKY